MRHELYSELRTLYEATPQNPRTYRITIKLKDMVDEEVLKHAVAKTMKRYPYFCVRLGIDEKALFFEDNPIPVPVRHTDEPTLLGSYETYGHLLAFCWWKNKVHLDASHALTDGGGLSHLIRTFLYCYCSEYYGRELSREGIWLEGDAVSPEEWADPARGRIDYDDAFLIEKWGRPAFQIMDAGVAQPTGKSIVYNIRISEKQFMRFNFSNEGSPGTIVALFLSRAIASVHPDPALPIGIAMCVNQRRALGAPLAHQSLVGDARLVYDERMKSFSFEQQVTVFRGMVAIQSDREMVRREVCEYQDIVSELEKLPTHEERSAYCRRLSDEKSKLFTATVSYVGKASLGDAEFYVQEYHVLPSTALPSCETPLTLEVSAVNGCFYVNFMQHFEGDEYLRAFIMQLRENDIDYDVLYQEPIKYPLLALPF